MNLKEAFRFQNKLENLMNEAHNILYLEENITKVQTTSMRKKVMPESEDEVTFDDPITEYSNQITEVASFLVYLFKQRELLCAAIYQAKRGMDFDAGMDGEVYLNGKRQDFAKMFRWMSGLRSSEKLIKGGGTGFRFNNEGNQVSYKCDIKKVTTINFDRNVIRKYCTELSKKADEISSKLDTAMINTSVDYEVPFDVNETFADVFERYLAS